MPGCHWGVCDSQGGRQLEGGGWRMGSVCMYTWVLGPTYKKYSSTYISTYVHSTEVGPGTSALLSVGVGGQAVGGMNS